MRFFRRFRNRGAPSALDVRDFAAGSHSFDGLISYDHWRKNVSGFNISLTPEELVVGQVRRRIGHPRTHPSNQRGDVHHRGSRAR